MKVFQQLAKKQKRKPDDITTASILAVKAKHKTTPMPRFCPEEAQDEGAQWEGGPGTLAEVSPQRSPPTLSFKSKPRQGLLKEHSSKPWNCEKQKILVRSS